MPRRTRLQKTIVELMSRYKYYLRIDLIQSLIDEIDAGEEGLGFETFMEMLDDNYRRPFISDIYLICTLARHFAFHDIFWTYYNYKIEEQRQPFPHIIEPNTQNPNYDIRRPIVRDSYSRFFGTRKRLSFASRHEYNYRTEERKHFALIRFGADL